VTSHTRAIRTLRYFLTAFAGNDTLVKANQIWLKPHLAK
jgi:hypothetical protein